MKITKKDRNLLIAMVIGDGHIDKNGTITIFHCEKQKDYAQYKFDLVKHLCKHSHLKSRQSNGTTQYGFYIRTSRFTKTLRRILYPNGKKVITRKILNRLSAMHLGIWWMDDGHCSNQYYEKTGNFRSSISTLSTCLSKEDNQVIIDWIHDTFNVKFGQRKMKNHFALVCRAKEGRKLADVIGNFVIPSMRYKLSD